MSNEGKRLFVVTVTSEYVVLAESMSDAEDVARDARRTADEQEDYEAGVMSHMPGGWNLDCLVYGDHEGDISLREAIEAGHGPEYVAGREKLRAMLEASKR